MKILIFQIFEFPQIVNFDFRIFSNLSPIPMYMFWKKFGYWTRASICFFSATNKNKNINFLIFDHSLIGKTIFLFCFKFHIRFYTFCWNSVLYRTRICNCFLFAMSRNANINFLIMWVSTNRKFWFSLFLKTWCRFHYISINIWMLNTSRHLLFVCG